MAGVLQNRWCQLVLGLICMMAISSPQYVWTLFTKPLTAQFGASLTRVQVTFSIFVVLQTFLSPLQGWLIERFGPTRLLATGAVLTGASWVFASAAGSLTSVYLTYGVLGGIGTGIIYVGIVGLMVAWFPDRRGMAAGVVAAGYGMGAVVTTFPIAGSIARLGYQTTLLRFGVLIGAVALAAALGMRRPPPEIETAGAAPRTTRGDSRTPGQGQSDTRVEPGQTGIGPRAMLKTPLFWLMFAMMAMMSTSGLMVISQMASFARDFGVADVTLLGMGALPLALTIDRFSNGLTRPFFGWVSDRIGREITMTIAFGLEAVAMTLWLMTRGDTLWFVVFSGLVFFGWGEIFSLFPSTLTDTFGRAHAITNYGFLYMAQGVGSVFGGPLAAALHEWSGSWLPVFYLVIGLDALTALLAVAVLLPARRHYLRAAGRSV